MPTEIIGTLQPDFRAGLVSDTEVQQGFKRCENVLFAESFTDGRTAHISISRSPSYIEVEIKPNIKLTVGDAAATGIDDSGNIVWWKIDEKKIYFENNVSAKTLEFDYGTGTPRIQQHNKWTIFSRSGDKVIANKLKIVSGNLTEVFEYLDSNETSTDQTLKAQSLGDVHDIYLYGNYAFVCGGKLGKNYWRWSKAGQIDDWNLLSKDGVVTLENLDASGFLLFDNAQQLYTQVAFNNFLYVFAEASFYRIERLGEDIRVWNAEIVSNDYGCKSRNGIIATEIGIFFPNESGIFYYDGGRIQEITNGKVRRKYLSIFKNAAKIVGVHWEFSSTVVFFYNQIGLAFNYRYQLWSEISYGLQYSFGDYAIKTPLLTSVTKNYLKKILYDDEIIASTEEVYALKEGVELEIASITGTSLVITKNGVALTINEIQETNEELVQFGTYPLGSVVIQYLNGWRAYWTDYGAVNVIGTIANTALTTAEISTAAITTTTIKPYVLRLVYYVGRASAVLDAPNPIWGETGWGEFLWGGIENATKPQIDVDEAMIETYPKYFDNYFDKIIWEIQEVGDSCEFYVRSDKVPIYQSGNNFNLTGKQIQIIVILKGLQLSDVLIFGRVRNSRQKGIAL